MRPVFGAPRRYNYRLWAGADLASVTGTWMQVLGVNWYLLQVTGSATRMGFGWPRPRAVPPSGAWRPASRTWCASPSC